MSCNGCRVLRKGCSENCILRPCLQWIETAEAQGHATVFVAKFFGRAGLTSFISAVPENQRQAVFQSLLFEAAGRTVNPVNGAVGLLWTGNWHVCQAAVVTVLKGGTLRPIQEFLGGPPPPPPQMDDSSDCSTMINLKDSGLNSQSRGQKRHRSQDGPTKLALLSDLDGGGDEKPRIGSPSFNDSEEESGTTTCNLEGGFGDQNRQLGKQPKLLNLFN